MKEKENVSLASAGLCLLVLVFRTGSPVVFERFDWMALVLLVLALICLWAPFLHVPTRRERMTGAAGASVASIVLGAPAEVLPEDEANQLPALPEAQLQSLQERLKQADWPREEGGMYDALSEMGKDQPLEAACAARGMLALLLRQAVPEATASAAPFALNDAGKLSQDDAVTLAQTLGALDTLSAAGTHGDTAETAAALLEVALLAMARLEHMA